MVFECIPLSHLLFFPKSLLTVSETANLPFKNILCPSIVLTFFVNFPISSFYFAPALLDLFDEALAILQVRLFVGFRHLKRAVAVQLFGLLFGWCSSYFRLFLFPETMVFVAFELFHEKLVSSFAFCQATRPPFTRTRVENENEQHKKN